MMTIFPISMVVVDVESKDVGNANRRSKWVFITDQQKTKATTPTTALSTKISTTFLLHSPPIPTPTAAGSTTVSIMPPPVKIPTQPTLRFFVVRGFRWNNAEVV